MRRKREGQNGEMVSNCTYVKTQMPKVVRVWCCTCVCHYTCVQTTTIMCVDYGSVLMIKMSPAQPALSAMLCFRQQRNKPGVCVDYCGVLRTQRGLWGAGPAESYHAVLLCVMCDMGQHNAYITQHASLNVAPQRQFITHAKRQHKCLPFDPPPFQASPSSLLHA